MVSKADPFEWLGGAVPLDFANTVSGLRGGAAEDLLGDYPALVAWSRATGVLGPREASAALEEAGRSPVRAARVLARARRLREAIHPLFAAVAAGRGPGAAALAGELAVLNGELSSGAGRRRLSGGSGGLRWRWAGLAELDGLLGPIALAAAELLTAPGMVRECAGATCGWLFLDATRNQSRRWCDMAVCGNRAKVRAHRQRLRRS